MPEQTLREAVYGNNHFVMKEKRIHSEILESGLRLKEFFSEQSQQRNTHLSYYFSNVSSSNS